MKRLHITLLLAILIGFAFANAARLSAQTAQGTLTVTITDAVTGQPLPNKQLRLTLAESRNIQTCGGDITTDRQGRYSCAVDPDSYKLLIADPAKGYVDTWYGQKYSSSDATPVQITAGQTTKVTVQLQPAGSISGSYQVPSPLNYGQIEFLAVRADSPKQSYVYRAPWSQAQGTYRIDGIPPGIYKLAIGFNWFKVSVVPFFSSHYANGKALSSEAATFVVTAGQTTQADIKADGLGAITGVVRDSWTEVGVGEGLELEAVNQAGAIMAFTLTEKDGSYRLPYLAPGSYTLRLTGNVQTIDCFRIGCIPYPYYPPQDSAAVATVTANTTVSGVDLELGSFAQSVTATIAPAGGALANAQVRTTFAAGAFADLTPVTLRQGERQLDRPIGTQTFTGLAFKLSAPVWPTQPYTLTVSYGPQEAAGVFSGTLELRRWNNQAWVLEPTVAADPVARTLTVKPTAVGWFALFGSGRRTMLPVVFRQR